MNATTPTPDGQTAAILDKARAGTRLTPDEALILAVAAPLHDLCEAALAARLVRHGKNAYYVRNIHINFTNVCVNACRFCAFSKVKGEPGSHTASVADIVAELAAHRDAVIREIHVVGGLNPELPLDYYLDMAAGLPCLASDIAPHREVLAETGRYFPVGDREALAAGLEAAAAEAEALLAARGTACRDRALTGFGWDKAAASLARAYLGLGCDHEAPA